MRKRGDLASQRGCPLESLSTRDDLVDQTDTLGLSGVDAPARDDHDALEGLAAPAARLAAEQAYSW
jgi:hypothetical protein